MRPGFPAPADKLVVSHMIVNLLQGATPIFCRVFQGVGELLIIEPFPRHRERSQTPVRCAWHAIGLIDILMAARTTHGGFPVIVRASHHQHVMASALVALPRKIRGRVAIDATRMSKHRGNFPKRRLRTRGVRGGRGRGGVGMAGESERGDRENKGSADRDL